MEVDDNQWEIPDIFLKDVRKYVRDGCTILERIPRLKKVWTSERAAADFKLQFDANDFEELSSDTICIDPRSQRVYFIALFDKLPYRINRSELSAKQARKLFDEVARELPEQKQKRSKQIAGKTLTVGAAWLLLRHS
jgi:hypothetical protein